jgi:tetratricopeptide (TPR) repeat protein
MKRLDAVTAAAPAVSLAPNMKGQLLLEAGKVKEAQEAFNIAIARTPKWWSPYRGYAYTQFAAKDNDGAIATLRGAEPKVDRPDLLGIEIASYYQRANDVERAIQEYDAVLKSSPHSDIAANNLAMLLVTFRKDAASIERAKTLAARFAESTNPSYLDTYGWVLFKHGEAAASLPVLQKVVSKEPDAPLALYHLGMAQSQSGSTVEALGNLSRAVKSGAKFDGLDEAKAALDKLAKVPVDPATKT